MTALDAANAYFEAWNARNGDAILASLGEDGTYRDPLTGGPISGEALKGYVEGLWMAFPDLNFQIVSVAETGGGRVAAEWCMRGTNHGSFRGLPPTGKTVETTGADFIETADGKVASVVGYFDAGAVPRQLGLQIVVQPERIDPFRLGTSAAVQTGSTEAPGAFSVTQLHARDEAAADEIRELSRRILVEMMGMPGFIGALTAKVGLRLVTMSAWTDADAPATFMRRGTHGEAMKSFFDGSLADGGYTSVWTPARLNAHWVRCTACGAMNDFAKSGGSCGCGAGLGEPPPYW